MNKFYLGICLILLSTLGFSVMPIFALYAYKGGITVPTLLMLRFILASVILGAYALLKYKRLSVTRRDLFFLFILGGICYTLTSVCYFTSVKFISPSLAVLVLYTYPIIVAVLSFLIDKERITFKLLASMALSFAGIFLFLRASTDSVNLIGVSLALAAAFVYSCYIIIGNRVVKQLDPIIVTVFVTVFTSIGLFTLGVATGELRFDFDAGVWLSIFGLVLFSSIVAILTFFKGLELLGPTKSSILSMLEPVFTAILSMLLFNEKLELLQMMGGIIVLIGALLVVITRQKVVTE